MSKKFLLGTFLSAMAVFTMNAANAADEAEAPKVKEILFKIHDIKPNKNKDGLVKSCNFFVTFYNRTDFVLDGATLDLSWKDDTGNYIIEQNKKALAESDDEYAEDNTKKTPVTEDNSTIRSEVKNVSTFVEMPALTPYTQGTVAARLNSEKCFLLFEETNFRVTSCNLKNQENSGSKTLSNSTNERSVESCSRMFRYVSPKDPEYYREFKAVSVAEQQKLLQDATQEEVDKIETKYQGVIANMDSANNILSNIR